MSTDEYVPDDDQIEAAYIEFESEPTSRLTDDNLLTREEAQGRWSRWLAAHDARVRRDAAREALDGLINECRTEHEEAATNNRVGGMVLELHAQQVAMAYRDAHYPEETP